MEIDEHRPIGVTLISVFFLIGSLSNFYAAFAGGGIGWWWLQLIGGIFQLVIAIQFYALNRTVFKIVVVLNLLGLVLSSLFVVRGFVHIFQSDIALFEIVVSLPMVIVSAVIAFYLKKQRVKNLFNVGNANKTSNQSLNSTPKSGAS